MCSVVELYTYCSKDKQYVEGVQKGKIFPWQMWVIEPWSFTTPCKGLETTSLFIKEQKLVEVKKGFFICHVTLYKAPNEHTNSLKEIIFPVFLNCILSLVSSSDSLNVQNLNCHLQNNS